MARAKNPAKYWLGKKNPYIAGENNPAKRPEVREKMSKTRKGIPKTQEWKDKLSKTLRTKGVWNKGKTGLQKHTEDWKQKNSERMKGNKHNYQGGKTPLHLKVRASLEYKLWRESVFKRDGYSCVWCKQIGGKLNADHIKPFANYPELRLAIDNGRTLCVDCHKKTDTFAGKTNKKNNSL